MDFHSQTTFCKSNPCRARRVVDALTPLLFLRKQRSKASAQASAPAPSQRSRASAFTLIEVVMGAGLIGVAASATLWALVMMNNEAAIARNMTGAQTAAQNQIDLILSDGPFNPQKTNIDGSQQVPPELQIGTQTKSNIAVYQDPKTGIVVPGTMTTTVSDISFIWGTFQIWTYRITVTVAYNFRGHAYSYSASTIRTSDI